MTTRYTGEMSLRSIWRFTLFLLSAAWVTIASAQTLQWLPPGPFSLDCTVLKRCLVGEPCEAYREKTKIDHDSAGGETHYLLPASTVAKGVIGMVTRNAKQTLLGSATADANVFFRVTVFDDGALTIQSSHDGNSGNDATYYGTCRQDSV